MYPEPEPSTALATSDFPKRIDVLDAFQLLRTYWRDARPVVPLFGAGISVESGIPLIGPIESYLKRLKWAYDRHLLPVSSDNKLLLHEYLLAYGWPSRHDVHQLLTRQKSLAGFGHSRGTMTTEGIEAQALASLQLPTRPNEAKWWEVFDAVTHSHAGLKDRLFDDLVRNRRPATTHQHAAFLAKAMNWRLILTTNFDELIEQSLSQQQLQFSVYALSENGSLPHPSLVRSNRSLIKMHGSAFALLTGAILDEPLEFRRWKDFLDCFGPHSLILILGYAGSDKRVTTLLRRFCADPRQSGRYPTQVLWVCRSRPPLNVDGVEGIQWLQYRDAGAFLQELHNQLISSHPASPTSYVALPQFPPAPRTYPAATAHANNQPVIAFTRRPGEFGTSSALLSFASWFRGDVIWCHLERIPNVDALFAHLQTELRRQDPDLPPFALFRTNSSAPAPHMSFEASDPRVDHLLEALQRSKYLIAMDSVGEFGERLSMQYRFRSASARRRPDEHKRLGDLLTALANRHRELGESVIAVAAPRRQKTEDSANNNIASSSNSDDSPLSLMWADVGEDALKTALPIHFVTDTFACVHDLQRLMTANGQREIVDHYHRIDEYTGRNAEKTPATFVKKAVEIFWDNLVTDDQHKTYRYKLLLLLSCAFRRSRGIVGLRRLVIPMWKAFEELMQSGTSQADLNTMWTAAARVGSDVWCARIDSDDRRELDKILRCLNTCGLLVHQEGGHWWMHRVVREALTKIMANAEVPQDSLHKSENAKLNDTIAVYYFERIFLPSKDPTAFVEYLFHRTRSLEYGTDDELLHRLEDLNAVLWRSRDHLLSQSQADTLIAWTEELADDVVEDICGGSRAELDAFKRVRRELRATLCDLAAEGRRQKCDYFGCLLLRLRQVRDRLQDNVELDKSFEDAGAEWDQLAIRLESVVSQQSMAVDRAAAGSILKQIISNARALVPEALQALCKQSDGKSKRSIRAAIDGFRLAEHLIDISVCTAELGYDRATWTEARANALDLLTTLSQRVAEILHTGLWPTVESVLRRYALRVLIRIGFRQMEISLSGSSLWLPARTPPDDQAVVDPRINEWYESTMRFLGEFHGLEDRDALHYRCFISALRARAANLSSDHSLAYQLLETASSVITPHYSGSEASALAVCHLFRAECLIKDADNDLHKALTSALASPKEASLISGLVRVEARARSYLERANIELAHAMRLLHGGRPHVKWWTRLYLLQAQLEHEWLAMIFLEEEFCLIGQRQELSMQIQGHLARGLRSLRLGIDCARQDWGARIQLAILHNQFYLWTEFGKQVAESCPNCAEGVKQFSEWQNDVLECALTALDVDQIETENQTDSVATNIRAFALRLAAEGHVEYKKNTVQVECYHDVDRHSIRREFLSLERSLIGHILQPPKLPCKAVNDPHNQEAFNI